MPTCVMNVLHFQYAAQWSHAFLSKKCDNEDDVITGVVLAAHWLCQHNTGHLLIAHHFPLTDRLDDVPVMLFLKGGQISILPTRHLSCLFHRFACTGHQ